MPTFLFDRTIFGPVRSRRLGVSLGINLLPNDRKLCSFDCLYCECGWNPNKKENKPVLPSRESVYEMLKSKLQEMAANGELPDVITFAGNGEPTLHPKFREIIDDTLSLRDQFAPKARVAVLSNSTMIFKADVVAALKKVDDNIMKLDSGVEATVAILNKPEGHFSFERMVENLISFDGNLIIQTLFTRGVFNEQPFDNTTEMELAEWMKLLQQIKPRKVMIYTIDRETPLAAIEKIGAAELDSIADLIRETLGLVVEVSY